MKWLFLHADPAFRENVSRCFDEGEMVAVGDAREARLIFAGQSFDGVIGDAELLQEIRSGKMDSALMALVLAESVGLTAQEFADQVQLEAGHLPHLALYRAATENDVGLATRLLEANPQLVKAVELPTHWTPLHRAAAFNSQPVAELLLQHGADPNATGQLGEVPLHMAGGPEIARMLIRHGASAHQSDQHGNSPMDWAVRERNQELILVLARAIPALGSPVYQLLRAARKAQLTLEAEIDGRWGIFRILTLGWTEREERCLAIRVSGPSLAWMYLRIPDIQSPYLGPEASHFPETPPEEPPLSWVAAPDYR